MRIGDCAKPIEPILGVTPGGLVFDRFQADPNLMVIPIVHDDGRPAGLIERNALFLRMAAAFGRELYTGRPISTLMNHQPVIADEDEPAEAFFQLADSADAAALLGGFISTRNGFYSGAGSVLEILRAASVVHHARADQMATLADNLTKAEAEARASSRARSEFLAVMSHEIRTPLNGVLGVARLLERKLEQADLKPYVSTILASGESLLGLLTDALDMSRAEAGVTQLDCEPLSLPDLVRDVDSLWRARAEEKALVLTVDLDIAGSGWVVGDRVRIKQLFNNLVGNALKFTSEGSVTLNVSTSIVEGTVDVCLTVEDTGPGIAEAVKEQIFEAFNTGGQHRKGAGAGLGLTICRQIVEAMGGTIRVFPALGKGARFEAFISLPESEIGVPVRRAPPEPTDHDTVHVLVVDDNATNRFVATKLLESFGCTCEGVEGGAQAIEAVAQGAFDLVLMDIQMPGMDGIEATRRIRDLDGPRLPIIALTANAGERDAQRYYAAGMDAVVCKPIDPGVLLSSIRQALAPPFIPIQATALEAGPACDPDAQSRYPRKAA
jgi:signal transduction histidine kinase/ActR/RegA family two-component response regulator